MQWKASSRVLDIEMVRELNHSCNGTRATVGVWFPTVAAALALSLIGCAIPNVEHKGIDNQPRAGRVSSGLRPGNLKAIRPPLDPDVSALSDRRRSGLVGRVRSVRESVEFTSSTKPRWNPQWASHRKLHYDRITIYDENGRMLSDGVAPGCGNVGLQAVQETFDSKGRIAQRVTLNLSGSLRKRVTFSYNSKGWLTEATAYDEDGLITSRWSYKHIVDSMGNWIGQIPLCQEGCAEGEPRALPVSCRAISYW